MNFDLNNIESFTLNMKQIEEINDEFRMADLKLNLMNELDLNLFGSHLLVTDHEDLIEQFVDNSALWVNYIKLFTEEEEYELCSRMMKTLNKMEGKYISFIVATDYNESAVNKIKKAKKTAIELLLKND